MDRETREQVIRQKCRENACDEHAQKRHFQFFVFERWDPHPPDDFREWLPAHDHNAKNPVPAWNCDIVRQEFYKHRGQEKYG